MKLIYDFISKKVLVERIILCQNSFFKSTVTNIHLKYTMIALHSQQKKNLKAFVNGHMFSGTKEYYYTELSSIQFRPAGTIISGFLQFEYPGSQSGKKGLSNNYNSENSFVFEKLRVSNEKMEEVANYIRNKINESKKAASTTIINETTSADELKKFKELLDMGAITQEEFETKKKQILGF